MATEAYRLTIGGLHYGAWLENVLHFNTENDGSVTPIAMAKHLVDDWETDNIVEWLGCCPDSYAIQWLEARRVSTGRGQSWVLEYDLGAQKGTLGTYSSSLSLAPVIRLYAATGVNVQGRIFMPPPAQEMLVNNVYDDDYIGAIGDLITSQLTFSNGGRTWVQSIHSRKLSIFTPVVEAALGNIIGNIGRRRMPR